MAKIFSSSRVVFNRSVLNDVNMRVFEGLCSGSLLMTNALDDNGQAEMFADGVHLATYRSPEDLVERVRYFLDHPDEREKIATAGRAEAVRAHTYRHRAERILAKCLGAKYDETRGLTSIVLHSSRGTMFARLAIDAIERRREIHTS